MNRTLRVRELCCAHEVMLRIMNCATRMKDQEGSEA